MNPLSVEDFERNVCVRLQLGLQAALDQIAATYATQDQDDGLAEPNGDSFVEMLAPERTTGGPSGFGDYYPGGTDLVTAWPSIEAAVPDLAAEGWDLAQIDADVALTLIVQVWLKDARFPVLNRMQKRYAAAIVDVLKVKGALGDCSIERLRIAWRTNPELRDENDRIQTGVLMFFELSSGIVRS